MRHRRATLASRSSQKIGRPFGRSSGYLPLLPCPPPLPCCPLLPCSLPLPCSVPLLPCCPPLPCSVPLLPCCPPLLWPLSACAASRAAFRAAFAASCAACRCSLAYRCSRALIRPGACGFLMQLSSTCWMAFASPVVAASLGVAALGSMPAAALQAAALSAAGWPVGSGPSVSEGVSLGSCDSVDSSD